MAVFEGYSHKEIGEVLGITPSASRSQLTKAKASLKEELKKIRDEVKEAMVSAAQSTGASNLPGALQRLVKDLTEPKMDWREILQQQIMSTIKSDYTWMRPSRKSWHTSAILPGQNNDEMIDICLALDASGSISNDQCKEFLTEVK